MDTLQGRDLKTAFWINEHQSLLVKIGHIIMMIIVAIIWLWFIVHVVIYIKDYNVTKATEQALLLESGNFTQVSRPVDLIIVDSGVLDAGGDTADAFAFVKNSNTLFAARFSYSFSVGGSTTEFADGFIMPNQEQYFVVRGLPSEGLNGSANFDMQDIIWEKLHGEPPNVQFDVAEINFGPADVVAPIQEEDIDRTGASDAFDESTAINTNTTGPQVVANTNEPVRLNINDNSNTNTSTNTNEDTEFATPDDVIEVIDEDTNLTKSDITALSTIVSNNSPVGFRTASVIAIVRGENNEVIAIHKQVVKNFNSFDQQAVNMNWPRRFIFSAKPEMYIYADYLNEDNLILLGEN